MKLENYQRFCGITNRVKWYAPVLALGVVVQLTLDHVHHDLVANQATLVHDLLGLLSEIGLLGDLGSQHVASSLSIRRSKQLRNSFLAA